VSAFIAPAAVETNRDASRTPRAFLVVTLVALVGIGLAYGATVLEMLRLWATSSTYAHGWLVLPVSVALAWRQRRELARLPLAPNAWGLLAVAAAVAMWVAGRAAQALVVQELAFVALAAAVVLTVCGAACLRRLAFPLGFLAFAVPFGEPLVEPLMQVTATGTISLLELTGIPVYRDGMLFSTRVGDFEVAEACSGIRYLIAFACTGALFAYLGLRTTRYRLMFAALSIVVPVLANTVRAYLIVLVAHASSMQLATGVDHLIYGWVFFGVVLAAVLWLGSWLRRRELRTMAPAADEAQPPAAAARLAHGPLPAALAALALGIAGPLATARVEARLASPTAGMAVLPTGADGWSGPLVPSGTWQPAFRGDPRRLVADYEHPHHGRVTLAYVWYPVETPETDVLGAGNGPADPELWRYVDAGTEETAGVALRSTRYVSRFGARRLSVRWLYAVSDRAYASATVARAMGTLERLRHPDRPLAFVAVARESDHGSDADAATDRALEHFAAAHVRALLGCARRLECRP
jgi:exosortase A